MRLSEVARGVLIASLANLNIASLYVYSIEEEITPLFSNHRLGTTLMHNSISIQWSGTSESATEARGQLHHMAGKFYLVACTHPSSHGFEPHNDMT